MNWLQHLADDVICVEIPAVFVSVGQHYVDFEQVSDAQVINALATREKER